MRILFLARSMLHGGCERQLAVLATALHQRGHPVAVALFYDEGGLTADLRQNGVPVIDLKKQGRWDIAGFMGRLVRAIRQFQPDLIHGYLPVPNCLALLAARLARSTARVVFGVRASDMRSDRYDRLSMLSYRLEEKLAPWADLTIANSQAGRDRAVAAGFPAERTIVIPNGIDTDRFQPNPGHRAAIRQQLGLNDQQPLIGLVGRLDPMKGHETFLKAASLLHADLPNLHFLCVGNGPDSFRQMLQDLATRLGIQNQLHWLPARQEIEQIYPALDVLVSASVFGEGFSNVVAEAMACNIPCLVTDVGDSARIVAHSGLVIPANDPRIMAEYIKKILTTKFDENFLRPRIIRDFSVSTLLDTTEKQLFLALQR